MPSLTTGKHVHNMKNLFLSKAQSYDVLFIFQSACGYTSDNLSINFFYSFRVYYGSFPRKKNFSTWTIVGLAFCAVILEHNSWNKLRGSSAKMPKFFFMHPSVLKFSMLIKNAILQLFVLKNCPILIKKSVRIFLGNF